MKTKILLKNYFNFIDISTLISLFQILMSANFFRIVNVFTANINNFFCFRNQSCQLPIDFLSTRHSYLCCMGVNHGEQWLVHAYEQLCCGSLVAQQKAASILSIHKGLLFGIVVFHSNRYRILGSFSLFKSCRIAYRYIPVSRGIFVLGKMCRIVEGG